MIAKSVDKDAPVVQLSIPNFDASNVQLILSVKEMMELAFAQKILF